ncbi:unnamed protein product [Linum tenue]|uniref:Uncharacterized protein n=1 Tax=Linum tenue TaxID=586396 RepID=A0AAV0N2S6_9ROSI|nr:unnamed protein product [Linum tenue]
MVIICMAMMGRIEGGRDIRQPPSSVPSTMDSSAKEKGYVELKRNHGGREGQVVVFGGKEVKNCMPKGFRHTSAPSRYVNYLPLLGSNCH